MQSCIFIAIICVHHLFLLFFSVPFRFLQPKNLKMFFCSAKKDYVGHLGPFHPFWLSNPSVCTPRLSETPTTCTPWKINMEHNHRGWVQIIFQPLKWVIWVFPAVHLPGCRCLKLGRFSRTILMATSSPTACLFGRSPGSPDQTTTRVQWKKKGPWWFRAYIIGDDISYSIMWELKKK